MSYVFLRLQCSKTCGDGFKRRTVQCEGGNARCNSNSRPQSIARCNLGLCPEWKPGPWSKVNIKFQSSIFVLIWVDISRRFRIDLAYTLKTSLPFCSYLPLQCSVTCGSGLKKRTVECVGLNSRCNPNTKPRSTLTCNNIPCPRWRTGEWSRVWAFILWLISAFV